MNLWHMWGWYVYFIPAGLGFVAAAITSGLCWADFHEALHNYTSTKSDEWEWKDKKRQVAHEAALWKTARRWLYLSWIWPLVGVYLGTRWIPTVWRTFRRDLDTSKEWLS